MNTRKTTLIAAIALIALAVLPTAISAEVTVGVGDVTLVDSTVTVPITVSEASKVLTNAGARIAGLCSLAVAGK